ncbi:MAG: GNAT family N-acetyltransferase [Rubrivivax sp.]|nr:GNAT family N-acetyltransferase [Pyrinomonadaceae bacterium]
MAAELLHADDEVCGHAATDGLETARLRLRMFRPEDLGALSAITRDPEVMRHIGPGEPLTREETDFNMTRIIEAFGRRGFGRWAVVRKDTGALAGYCGLSCGHEEIGVELAYLFARAEWGKGLATEAASACLRYGFERLGLDSIAALTRHENARSRRVMERLGMTYLRAGHYYGYSCVCYSIPRDEWRPDDSMYRVSR